MSDLTTRDYHIRDMQLTGRTLVLACVPFDTPNWVMEPDRGEFREVFRRGAFAGPVADPRRTKLRVNHDQSPIAFYGHGLELREDARYLMGEFRVTPGPDGDKLLELVHGEEFGGVSIGFTGGFNQATTDADGPLVEHTRIKRMPEVSLVDEPAYTEAKVLAVREKAHNDAARAELRAWVASIRPLVV